MKLREVVLIILLVCIIIATIAYFQGVTGNVAGMGSIFARKCSSEAKRRGGTRWMWRLSTGCYLENDNGNWEYFE